MHFANLFGRRDDWGREDSRLATPQTAQSDAISLQIRYWD